MGIAKVNPNVKFEGRDFFKDIEKPYWQE